MTSPTPPPSNGGEPAAPARGRARLVLGTGVLLLAGGGVVAQRALARGEAAESAPPQRRTEQAVIDPEPFVLNLPDEGGDRWLRLDLALAVDDAELAERANGGLLAAVLRDRLLATLARTRPGALVGPDAKEALRGEVRAAAEALLAEPPFTEEGAAPARVLDVYFTELLLQ